MRPLLVFSVGLSLAACVSVSPSTDGLGAAVPQSRFAEEIVSYYQFSSGINAERHVAIRSQSEWEEQWLRLTARHGSRPAAPQVDFSREMLLMAAMGDRPTGGYAVSIERVVDRSAAFEVFVRHTSPGPRCFTTQAITSPVDIVRVAASAKPVRWNVVREVRDCT